jgi:hypothetical protein
MKNAGIFRCRLWQLQPVHPLSKNKLRQNCKNNSITITNSILQFAIGAL